MSQNPDSLPARIFMGIFTSIFGCVGLTVLIFLWGAPMNEFHSPPLFFRIVGSFIAIAFIAFSAFGVYSAITGRSIQSRSRRHSEFHSEFDPPGTYGCPSCGAGLGEGTEVSPSGDVKCVHCGNWFNVRQN